MKARDEAKLNMYDAVITHANANPAIIATVPAFQTTMNAFGVIRTNLVSALQLAESETSGVAIDKSVARETLTNLTLQNAGALFAYAASVNNNELREKARITRTKLDRLRDELLKPQCQEIHDLANDNIAALPTFGITAGTLALYQAAIDNYDASVAKPRNAVSQRVAYKETIKTLFQQGDNLLKNQLDKLAEQFKSGNAEFYNAYKSNRVILDPGSSPTQASGTIVEVTTNNPIAGVLVKALTTTYSATTALDGTYSLKIPVPGTYTIEFSKTGYKTNTKDIEIVLGQTTELDFGLEIA